MSPLLLTTSQRGKSAIELEAHGMVDMMVSGAPIVDLTSGETDREIRYLQGMQEGGLPDVR